MIETSFYLRIRAFVERCFWHFGVHCATHQIRLILINSVVITSLFYPALALYFSSSPTSPKSFIFSPKSLLFPSSHVSEASDVHNLWSSHASLQVLEDMSAKASCGSGRTLRVEQILVQSPLGDEEDDYDSALNNHILVETLTFETNLQTTLKERGIDCLKGRKHNVNECFVLSPLAFWEYDKDRLLRDQGILDTLSPATNVSIDGIPVTPQMVLAGRGELEHHKFDYATFLVLTLFFPDNDCTHDGEHDKWLRAVKDSSPHAELSSHSQTPTVVALEYDPIPKPPHHLTALSFMLFIAYSGFFVYVFWSMRRMNKLHSRIGVTFTALVEIAVSTITSLSVCALVGFKITMVPWELLPIVIVFVGAENMFSLVDAVSRTPVTLAVSTRIASGLSLAGTSNTLKLVSYNTIFGVIGFFASGAIQQFCVFAIVVLVAHWFLAHGFFVTVLSIDVQRLELEDLMQQNANTSPPLASSDEDEKPKEQEPPTNYKRFLAWKRSFLIGRARKNISLCILLALTATLYYTAYPAHFHFHFADVAYASNSNNGTPTQKGALHRPKNTSALPASSSSRGTSSLSASQVSSQAQAKQIWGLLNPRDERPMHLRMEMPSVLTFPRPSASATSSAVPASPSTKARSRTRRTIRALVWLLQIEIFPICATTSLLWGLVTYLLKDTERLEAQKGRATLPVPLDPELLSSSGGGQGEFGRDREGEERLEGKVAFETFPRGFVSDVEMVVASGRDGGVVAVLGFRDELVVYFARASSAEVGGTRMVKVDVKAAFACDDEHDVESESTASRGVMTAIALDWEGRYLAVGTGSGAVVVWEVDGERKEARVVRRFGMEARSAGVAELRLVRSAGSLSPTALGPGKLGAAVVPTVLVCYQGGAVVRWESRSYSGNGNGNGSEKGGRPNRIEPISGDKEVVKAYLLDSNESRVFVAFVLDDGTVDVLDSNEEDPFVLPSSVLVGNPADRAAYVAACQFRSPSNSDYEDGSASHRLVLATVSEHGVVSIWDVPSGQLISTVDETLPGLLGGSGGRINKIYISAITPPTKVCHTCGQPPVESYSLAFSYSAPPSSSSSSSTPVTAIQIHTIYIPSDDRQIRTCSCASTKIPRLTTPVGNGSISMRRSRSASQSFDAASASGPPSPLTVRKKLSTSFEAPSFPVSAHGLHSRRASEHRRPSETLAIPSPTDELDGRGLLGVGVGSGTASLDSSGYPTPNSATTRRGFAVPVIELTCERGTWGVSGDSGRVFGVRRRARSRHGSSSPRHSSSDGHTSGSSTKVASGLSDATLERWEAWTFDPAFETFASSALLALRPASSLASHHQKEVVPRLPFTKVAQLHLAGHSRAYASFGNTIGCFTDVK